MIFRNIFFNNVGEITDITVSLKLKDKAKQPRPVPFTLLPIVN